MDSAVNDFHDKGRDMSEKNVINIFLEPFVVMAGVDSHMKIDGIHLSIWYSIDILQLRLIDDGNFAELFECF